jgi:hypothetical protein
MADFLARLHLWSIRHACRWHFRFCHYGGILEMTPEQLAAKKARNDTREIGFARADVSALIAALEAIQGENARLREALTPSEGTKAAYIGEFSFSESVGAYDEAGYIVDHTETHIVPWTTIKEIMAAIRRRAATITKGET